MLADAVTTKASIAEVARMAASSNLRIQLTSFAAQTVPAPGLTTDQSMEASETHSRGRRTNPAAPRITAAALTPPPNRRQARETHASTCGSHPVPGRNATSAGSLPTAPEGNFAGIAVLHLAVLHSLSAVLQVTAPPC